MLGKWRAEFSLEWLIEFFLKDGPAVRRKEGVYNDGMKRDVHNGVDGNADGRARGTHT